MIQPAAQHKNAIIAAAKRGISCTVIARAIGVSSERIRQILVAADVSYKRSPGMRPGKRSFRQCRECGLPFTLLHSNQDHCSRICAQAKNRRIDIVDIDAAIAARRAGQTWKTIAKQRGVTQQAIQIAIWNDLGRRGCRNRRLLDEIWRVSKSGPGYQICQAKYGWIERSLGGGAP